MTTENSMVRHRKLTQMLSSIRVAVEEDVPLVEGDLEVIWDDVFLTNVVVPYLEHIRDHYIEEAKTHAGLGGTDFVLLFGKNAESIAETIHLCKEWRG